MFEKIAVFFRGKEARILLPLALFGVVLLLFAGRMSASGAQSSAEESSPLAAYEDRLEEQLRLLCGSMEGVGRCRVMIRCAGEAKRTFSGGKVVYEEVPEVVGVTVVCEGGDRASVRAALTEAITALFGIGANRVSVRKME